MRPVDWLVAGYLGFVTVVILARGGLGEPAYRWLLLMHVFVALLLFLFRRLRPGDRAGGVIRDLYPLVLLTPLYAEIGVLNLQLGVEPTFARDAVVQQWEAALFGEQIAYTWIRNAPSVFWSGVLHVAYFAYYPIVVLGPVLLLIRGQRRGVRRVLFATMLAFVTCYVVFILYPVAGPNYLFEEPTGPVREVWSARLVYAMLRSGSSFGAAFPSSHVAATVAGVLAVWFEWRALASWFVVPAVLLVVGTIYCQMHYGVDVVAGLLVGVGAVAVARTTIASRERPYDPVTADRSPVPATHASSTRR